MILHDRVSRVVDANVDLISRQVKSNTYVAPVIL